MFNPTHYWRMQSMMHYHLAVQEALRQSHIACIETGRIAVMKMDSDTASDYSSGAESGSTTSSIEKSPMKKKECQYCPAVFKSNTDLRRHERVHTGEKPFQCNVCQKQFNRKGNMEKHMTTHFKGKDRMTYLMEHLSSKPYICPCGKSFRSKGFFDRHQQKHHINTESPMSSPSFSPIKVSTITSANELSQKERPMLPTKSVSIDDEIIVG